VRPFRLLAVLAMLCLLAGLNAGCLSLSMLNHEAPDTKDRLDSLENRVSALEAGRAAGPAAGAVPLPGTVTISPSGAPTASPMGSVQHLAPPPSP
jgi:hypothetical protein